MPINVIMPALGVAQQTGNLLKWLEDRRPSGLQRRAAHGDRDRQSDGRDRSAGDPASLAQVIAKAGDQVPVGQRIGLILAAGESRCAAGTELTPVAIVQRGTVAQEAVAKRTAKSPSPSVSLTANTGRILASLRQPKELPGKKVSL